MGLRPIVPALESSDALPTKQNKVVDLPLRRVYLHTDLACTAT